ncbi:MAG: Zeta toxin family protein [Myxococcales bacterium]|nr:Zeta toxin family protein [Myxococcales bacterium]
MAVSRVAERVAHGGHDVPPEVIRRRFAAGLENFELLYKPIVSDWILYDNTDREPVTIDSGENP